jgi:uncharacterized protein (TIGR03435 family)
MMCSPKKFVVLAALLLFRSIITPAQNQPLAFEVASVRPNKSTTRDNNTQILPGGKLLATNLNVRALIMAAYGLSAENLVMAGPDWLSSEKYDVQAAAEMDAIPLTTSGKELSEKVRLMLQSLLADRFKLKIRHELKAQDIYSLVIAKGGPKLVKASVEEKDCLAPQGIPCHQLSAAPVRGFHGEAVSISDLVARLQVRGRIVVDKTNLSGLFSIHTTAFRPEQPGPGFAEEAHADPESLPTVFTLLEEQLGLRLEASRNSIEVLVIDHVEKPSEN